MPSTLETQNVVPVNLQLNASSSARLNTLAIAKNCSSHELMNEAIERYLHVEERQQEILKSLDDSVAHFEATGQHITLDELMGWSDAVKLDRTTQPPTCHR